jgi:hypothetical protein
MPSAQLHLDLDPTTYSIPEETRSFLLKVVRGIDLFAFVAFSFRLSTGQDATEAFEDVGHSDEARALLPGMLVGDFEQDSVSDHTALLQLHSIAYLSPLPLQNIKLKSGAAAAQESRISGAVEQGSKCVFPSDSYLLLLIPHLIVNSLMYFLPLGLLGAYFAWRYYTTGSA